VEIGPWRLFAVEEKRRIGQYFNAHQYEVAATALGDLLPRLGERERVFAQPVCTAAEGFAAWDRFEHKRALSHLQQARAALEERCRAAGRPDYDGLIEVLGDDVVFLGEVASRTGGFTRKHPVLVADLLANADRRLEEGKFDDAVARLYRALELWGQCAFEARFGVETGRTPPERLPAGVRDEYRRRYAAEEGLLKLPLVATYEALAAAADPSGERFVACRDEIRNVLSARNDSILAHGTRPVSEEQARKLRDLVQRFLPMDVRLPRFPKLPW
jgi:CRISPR-associated protein (TIGR02710 family)